MLFQRLPALYLLLLALYLMCATRLSMRHTVAWSLILSGGVGNLLDRLAYDGRVVDFMNLGIGTLRTGIFNVADICITIVGVLLTVEAVWHRQVPRASDSPH